MNGTTALPRFGVGLRSLRWLVLGVFPVLYVIANRALAPLSPWFAALTLLGALSCALLLVQLAKPPSQTLWAWVGLFVFIDGDFFKMIILARRLHDPTYIASLYPELESLTRETILHGYAFMTLGFITYCVVAAAALTRTSRPRIAPQPDQSRVRLRTDLTLDLAAGVFLVYLLATLLQVKSGYGVLGATNQGLSGPIGTFLTLLRRYLTPALLLLSLWIFDRRNPALARFVALSILMAGVIDAFATNSRGSVVAFMTPVFLLYIVTGRVTMPRRAFVVATAVAIVVLFPIISALRFHTKSSTNAEGQTIPAIQELVGSGTVVLARVQGAEGVWFAVPFADTEFSVSRTAHFLHSTTLRDYYTYTVVGVTQPNTYEAPGLIGAFMIIGGNAGVVILMAGFVLLVERSWSFIARRFQTWPVGLALTASYLLGFISEGTLLVGDLVKLALVVLTCELVYTRLLGRAKSLSDIGRDSGEHTEPAQKPAITGP